MVTRRYDPREIDRDRRESTKVRILLPCPSCAAGMIVASYQDGIMISGPDCNRCYRRYALVFPWTWREWDRWDDQRRYPRYP